MSYEVMLYRPTNSMVVEEDQIIEDDRQTVMLNRPMNSTGNTIVRINDRGPFARRRIIDLSYAAAKKIGMIQGGVAKVRIEIIVRSQ